MHFPLHVYKSGSVGNIKLDCNGFRKIHAKDFLETVMSDVTLINVNANDTSVTLTITKRVPLVVGA